ncbi:MAG: carbohydrate-binding protein [Bacillota bacterium]
MAVPSNFGEHMDRLKSMYEANYPQGVVVDPTPITASQEIAVLYYGLLAKSGAEQIYLHVGYGAENGWQNVYDYKMSKTGWGWVKTLEMPEDQTRFNFCFKDSAGNWDNNNGVNWSFTIHDGRIQQ